MRSRLFVLSTIIGACLAVAPAVASAQRVHSDYISHRYDPPRYHYHYHYDFGEHGETARFRAAERAARAEARSESRAESRAELRDSATRRRFDRDFMRHNLSMRTHDRIDASRGRSRIRW